MKEQRIISGEAVLMRLQESFRNWARGHSCHILAKNLVTFCLSPMNLSKADFNSNGLICLEKNLNTGLYSGHVIITLHGCDPGLQAESNKQGKGTSKVYDLEREIA